jgi:hypothetical protein
MLVEIDAQVSELDGKHFVNVTIGAVRLPKKGPFDTRAAAEAAAAQVVKNFTPTVPATKTDAVIIGGREVALDSDLGRKLTLWAVRAAEGLVEDSELRAELEIFDDTEFKALSTHPGLIRAIREERFRRINSGRAAREAAAKIHVRAPAVLGTILDDKAANARHRIESARELRATATGGNDAEKAHDSERFVITFNLGNDVEKIEKIITPKPPQIEGEVVKQESSQ